MAQITANAPFRMDGVDFNYTVRTQVGFEFYDNTYERYGSSTYEDVALVQYGASGTLIAGFGGRGVRWNGDYTVATAGSVTGYLELAYVNGAWRETLLIENMFCTASDLVAAFMSRSTADDHAIMRQALSGDDGFTLSRSADYARGYDGNDGLVGSAGNDTLFGDGGNDYLHGGNDHDHLDGGTGNDSLDGSSGTDTLFGDAGHDTLDGGTGTDVLRGGSGNDRYTVESTRDVIVEEAGEGTDTVTATTDYTLSAHIETLILTGNSGVDGTGNAQANTLTGDASANLLDGADGNDTLIGNHGHDELRGRDGNDLLRGGIGTDRLRGGSGADVFDFDRASDLGTRDAGTLDVIFDFSRTEGDKIDLSSFTGTFRYLSPTHGSAGDVMTVWVTRSGDNCYVNLGLDSDAQVDGQIKLVGVTSLSASDFVL